VGTRGRVVDHIGFEVKDLEALCRKLEGMCITLDRPYAKVPALNIAIAFISDPWGTYLELTEGLDKVALPAAAPSAVAPAIGSRRIEAAGSRVTVTWRNLSFGTLSAA
jgi:hypothetical protein